MSPSPFALQNEDLFKRWRDIKFRNYPSTFDEISISIKNPLELSRLEKNEITRIVKKTGLVHYTSDYAMDPSSIIRFGEQIGLKRINKNPFSDEEAVSCITDKSQEGKTRGEYIPYTNKAIQWHTDGYYNPPEEQINGFILHCVQKAAVGGENDIMDPEIIYALLRDRNKDALAVLMQNDVLFIPANEDKTVTGRPDSIGPVFSVANGNLHMRYTARKTNIHWKEDSLWAVEILQQAIDGGSEYYFSATLENGQGILTNNSLHRRGAFQDTPHSNRLMYRARYYDRISGAEF